MKKLKIFVKVIEKIGANLLKIWEKLWELLKKIMEMYLDFSKVSNFIKRNFKMIMKYPKEYLDEIKLRLKVSQVVGKYVQLKKEEKNLLDYLHLKMKKHPLLQ